MECTKDLTKGDVKKQLIFLALPLIWGNILQQLYNTADSYMVGRYMGHKAFAAVGVSGSIMNLFIFVLNGGCNGISIIFAELYGERNWEALRKESFLSVAFGGIFAAGLSVLGIVALNPLLRMIQTPGEVEVFARDYLWVIYLGLPVTFLYNWCSAALRAAGDTRAALWVLLAAVLLNAALDFWFLAFCRMGISGTAMATAAAQLFAAVACLAYLKRRYPVFLFRRKDISCDRGLLLKTVRFGAVSALHQSSLYIGKLLVQGAVNGAGTEAMSAYAMTMRIEGFANSFGDSGSTAISVFVAQNKGAGENGRVGMGFREGMRMMATLGICLSFAMVAVTPYAVSVLMGEVPDGIMGNVLMYMKVISVFYVLCFIGNSFVGFYRGLGMVHIPALGTALHISIRVIGSYLLMDEMGLAAVAAATGAGWLAVVGFQGIVYKREIPGNLLR